LTITTTDTDSFGVVGKVDHSVLNPLKVFCFAIHFIEHSVFPTDARRPAQRPRTLVRLKLTSIVSVLDEELHVFRDVNVNNDRSVIFDVKLKIVEILYFVT
jgi:hypothetical protein